MRERDHTARGWEPQGQQSCNLNLKISVETDTQYSSLWLRALKKTLALPQRTSFGGQGVDVIVFNRPYGLVNATRSQPYSIFFRLRFWAWLHSMGALFLVDASLWGTRSLAIYKCIPVKIDSHRALLADRLPDMGKST